MTHSNGVDRVFHRDNSAAVSYVNYWAELEAQTAEDLFLRYLFAFCSVHTTWESNVRAYEAIKNYREWTNDKELLWYRLFDARAGMHNNRAKWIFQFAHDFWASPAAYSRGPGESWACARDRIELGICGLGPAKTSFALELAYPLQAEVVCLDVHMLRLYGRKQDLKVGEYHAIESDWINRCRVLDLPSYIIKQMHWDALQGRPDSRYWSYVLEN